MHDPALLSPSRQSHVNVSQDLSVALIVAGVVAILIGVFGNKTLKAVALGWVAAP